MSKFWMVLTALLFVWGFLTFSVNYTYAEGVGGALNGGGANSSVPGAGIDTDSNTLLPFVPSGDYPGIRPGDDIKGSEGVLTYVQGGLFGTAKKLLAPVLIFLIVGFGIRLIIAGGNEEE